MNQVNDGLWRLQCKNVKCKSFFDYFGRVLSNTGISCSHCGIYSKHVVADFVRHKSALIPSRKSRLPV